MQIIIEVKNPHILHRLLELLRLTEWLGGVKIWRKADSHSQKELVYDFTPLVPAFVEKTKINYREFYGIIQPKMSIETIDRIIAEMRED